MRNTLYYGDNLDVLRSMPDECVDLIYLDPPFNSKRNYNVIFKEKGGIASPAQVEAFQDTWSWSQTANEAVYELTTTAPPRLSSLILGLQNVLGDDPLMSYLALMAQRIVELHRVLRSTGSLYLHCDPTASHYLKLLLDAVFGSKNFRNEIVWKRTTAHSSSKKYAPVHDTILYYSKSSSFTWNEPRTAYDDAYLNKYYRFDDGDGRLYWRADLCAAGVRNGRSGLPWRGIDPTAKGMHWKFTVDRLEELDAEGRIYWPKNGVMPQYKRYRDELKGKAVGDIWDDISRINPVGGERLGYQTQKPLALLDRIIQASSNPGDTVLDPFCGCGTAVAAAERLGRSWIGIDITYLAIAVMQQRFRDHFSNRVDYAVKGTPMDAPGARALFEQSPYQFQYWVIDKLGINARPRENKGRDRGIDGEFFYSDDRGRPVRGIIQVKGGKTGSRDIRDFRGTMEREHVDIGIFVCMQKPTRDMESDALAAGLMNSMFTGKRHRRIQILTIDDLFDGRLPDIPYLQSAHKQAPVLRRKEDEAWKVPIDWAGDGTAADNAS